MESVYKFPFPLIRHLRYEKTTISFIIILIIIVICIGNA